MKNPAKKILVIVLIPLCVLLGLGAFRIWYGLEYAHQHCIVVTSMAFRTFAEDHGSRYPFSTNGFGNALLLLVRGDYLGGTNGVAFICGPNDDGHVFKEALKNNSIVPEDQCSRVYIQGLSVTNNPDICILFDHNSCRGGDHFRSPWGYRLREVLMLDGEMRRIRDDDWPEFSRRQVDLLVAAGFSRTNALHFYPAAN